MSLIDWIIGFLLGALAAFLGCLAAILAVTWWGNRRNGPLP